MDSSHLENDIGILPGRVAGHSFVDGAKAGVACEKSTGYILKVVDGDERGERELRFYEKLYKSNLPSIIKLRKLCPPFYGARVIQGRKFMRLGDVTFGGHNVMDIKIGAITWDHLASKEKIEHEKSKYPWQQELQFKILGYRFTRSNGEVEILEKKDACTLCPIKVRSAIQKFMSSDADGDTFLSRKTIFINQLEQIKDFIENDTTFKFISSSILFSYNNVPCHGNDDHQEGAKVTMIDFAHTFEVNNHEVDINYFNGLTSLLSVIHQCN